MRAVFVLLSILLVAACASGNQAEPTDENGQVSAAQPLAPDSPFDDVAALDTQFDAAIRPICGPPTETSGNIECARGVLLTGFDTTGEARNNCPATSCHRLQIAMSFGLTDSDDTMCGSLESKDWKRCIWNAFVRNEFENARLRM